MPKLLIVDDEPNVVYSLRAGLEADDLEIITAPTAKFGLAAVGRERPDVVIVDVRLPDLGGLELFDRIKQLDPRLPVVIVTAHGSTDTAIEATKRGAFDYLLKPVDLHQLRAVIGKAIELRRMRSRPAVFTDTGAEPPADTDSIVGRSTAMQDVFKAVGRVAGQDMTVLLLGESGTGKELVARAIYQHSHRADKPFLAINCAAIPEALLESELFGHEKGAFTGADQQRVGKFEQASGGTLFLDEIGDMTPATQAKVLRLLQDQRFERVGGRETITADVRVIAATHRDLPTMVTAGTFRQDLLYRLNGFVIPLPPLRDRPDDIPLLADHFLNLYGQRMGKPVCGFTPDASVSLQQHLWPGTVRELQNAIRYAVIQASGETITPDNLPVSVRNADPHTIESTAASGRDIPRLVESLLAVGSSDIYRTVHAAVDRLVFEDVLRHVGGNQVQASELLGISRTTLRAKLAALGQDNPQ